MMKTLAVPALVTVLALVVINGQEVEEVIGWGRKLKLGQISGVGVDLEGRPVVFHRGSNEWDYKSFDDENQFTGSRPTAEDLVMILDPRTGDIIKSWGKDPRLFYLPHGLFVDHEGNTWLTDVALHQVFKFASDSDIPEITLGKQFEPGEDTGHFCMPTDVVVDPTDGSIYVADGYCNTRIVKLSAEGEFQMVIGHLEPNSMGVVHSVTLAQNYEHVCASDRDNGRILCFDARTGEFLRQFKLPEFGERVFAARYSAMRGGILFVISGNMGFAVSYTTGELIGTWSPRTQIGFQNPRDIAISSEGDVYVGEIGPNTVWKFRGINMMKTSAVPALVTVPARVTIPALVTVLAPVVINGQEVEEVIGWGRCLELGQVSGVGVDPEDSPVVFHRGSVVWDYKSFDDENQFTGSGPIAVDLVGVLDPRTGDFIKSWGKDHFYLPHGLFVDHEGNTWLTDVALHQVFKFAPDSDIPEITLGKQFEPGEDTAHFCKPTDVVVDPTDGSIYVADGYCNSRIVKFSADGEIQMVIGDRGTQHLIPNSIVTSVTLAQNYEHVCASDRDNGRILCFDARTGEFLRQFKLPEFGERVFAARYSARRGGILFVISGNMGFAVSYTTGELIGTWSPRTQIGFQNPRDIAISSEGDVYVGEIGPNKVWKFRSVESDL